MATESVATINRNPFYLPNDAVNLGDTLCIQIQGIVGCIQAASLSNDAPADGDIANACWVVNDLAAELREVIAKRQKVREEAHPLETEGAVS